jgi:hypothetical protein
MPKSRDRARVGRACVFDVTGKALKVRGAALAAGLGVAAGYASAVHAHDFGQLNQTLAVRYSDTAASTSGSFIDSWLAMVTATQNAQPHWMTPLVTVTRGPNKSFAPISIS